jgi:hypothetical protein
MELVVWWVSNVFSSLESLSSRFISCGALSLALHHVFASDADGNARCDNLENAARHVQASSTAAA